MGQRRFQQCERADDIRRNKIGRAVNGAINVALGGEMNDGCGSMLAQQPIHQFPIANIALDKHMPRIAFQGRQVGGIAGIGKLVERNHAASRVTQNRQDKIRADETGSAGDQNSG